MTRRMGDGASSCWFVHCAARQVAAPGIGMAEYAVSVPASGDYFVWTRARGLDWNRNSFFFSIDGGPAHHDEIPQNEGRWTWIWQEIDVNPISLERGVHRFGFAGREEGARLDLVLLTNSKDYTPSGRTLCGGFVNLPLVLRPSTARLQRAVGE